MLDCVLVISLRCKECLVIRCIEGILCKITLCLFSGYTVLGNYVVEHVSVNELIDEYCKRRLRDLTRYVSLILLVCINMLVYRSVDCVGRIGVEYRGNLAAELLRYGERVKLDHTGDYGKLHKLAHVIRKRIYRRVIRERILRKRDVRGTVSVCYTVVILKKEIKGVSENSRSNVSAAITHDFFNQIFNGRLLHSSDHNAYDLLYVYRALGGKILPVRCKCHKYTVFAILYTYPAVEQILNNRVIRHCT